MHYREQINAILCKAEARGALGSSGTFNEVLKVLAENCDESNVQELTRYIKTLDCASGVSNVENLLRQKAGS